jgi:mono/diheme cytochrome c family protein
VKLHTVFLTTAAFITLAACNPAPADAPTPATPPPADIAAPTAPSGPAAENTTDTLSSTPPADMAAAPAPPATTPAPPPAAAVPTKAQLTNGSAVYARTCAMCHGPSGEGTQMGVALTAGHDAATVKEKVIKGVIKPGDKMPPLGAALSPADLDDVAAFIESGLPQ